jgi:hypothetical protein
MADYRIWGQLTQTGPQQFVAVASAVSIEPDTRAMVEHVERASRTDAETELERLIMYLGAKVRESGHRVVDVEG